MTGPDSRVVDVVVIGGGIAGLAAAHAVRARGRDVLLLEASDRLGGAIHTEARDGYLIEWGPNTVRGGKAGAALLAIAHDCGLSAEIIHASSAARRRYIQHADTGALVAVAPPTLLASPLLPLSDRAALLAELFIPGRAAREDDADETIAQFVSRRLSRGFADRVIAPLVGGIYAGDIDALSVRAVFPRMVALEQRHGGLMRGAVALKLAQLRASVRQRRSADGASAATSREPSTLVSFRDGFRALPSAIATTLGHDAIRTRCPIEAIAWRPDINAYAIEAATGDRLQARNLIIATPTHAAATLLGALDPELEPACEALRAIPYAPVAIVAIGLRREQVAHALDGFGFLIPPLAGRDLLGCLFSAALFEGRAPDDHILLTNFVGGALHPHTLERSDAAIIADTLEALRQPLGLRLAAGVAPAFSAVHRWPRAIPQYTLGHLDRVAAIMRTLERCAATTNLVLAGNYLTGVSLNDTIANATSAAAALLEREPAPAIKV